MKITPETKTLAAIFQTSADDSYRIPPFQRNFSWKAEQIETLFEDIRAEPQGYYVGNLLINKNSGSNDVIDGQQRLTTLSLFLLAVHSKLCDFLETKEHEKDAKTMYITCGDIERQLQLKDGEVRLKLLDNDQRVWENLTLSLSGKQSGRWGKYTLYKPISLSKMN
jgi:hypothetical protein